MTAAEKAKLNAKNALRRSAEKAEKEHYHALRAAEFKIKQAATVQRNKEQLLALDVVPEEDFAAIAAQELAEELGLDVEDIEEVVADSGQDWPKYQRWIKKGSTIFLFQVGDYVYPATVTPVDIVVLGENSEFYRGDGDVALLVDAGRTIPRSQATWDTVDSIGTPTADGDKILVVGDDDLHLQDVASSAFSAVAVGNYKLSEIAKPKAFEQDLGGWLD